MKSDYRPYLKEILIDEHTLQARIRELGAQLSSDYAHSDNLLLVCILKGGIMFLTDLTRAMTVPHEIDFMAASSYGKGARSATGSVRIEMDIRSTITDRDVLVVEDIIDSGYTLHFVIQTLRARNPRSLKLCTLLDKASRREIPLQSDYVGFTIENKFVFGYGLDLDERWRNLPFVGVVDEDVLRAE
jgi:hypoxanthine phosphoribosyltransferase